MPPVKTFKPLGAVGFSGAECTLCRILADLPPFTVGASLLAKNLSAPRVFKIPASSLAFFASKLAPTVCHAGA
ncbi:hypothetical protein DK871_11855 [Pseudomonas sp. L13]|nr:hypothetical protein [Pseudomonas sp. L13]